MAVHLHPVTGHSSAQLHLVDCAVCKGLDGMISKGHCQPVSFCDKRLCLVAASTGLLLKTKVMYVHIRTRQTN